MSAHVLTGCPSSIPFHAGWGRGHGVSREVPHNLTASSQSRADGQSASLGLVFEDVSNPFFSAVHRGVEEVARERGVLTFAGSSDEEPERERQLAESFGARGVDGLLIVPAATDHSYLLRDRAAGVAL